MEHPSYINITLGIELFAFFIFSGIRLKSQLYLDVMLNIRTAHRTLSQRKQNFFRNKKRPDCSQIGSKSNKKNIALAHCLILQNPDHHPKRWCFFFSIEIKKISRKSFFTAQAR